MPKHPESKYLSTVFAALVLALAACSPEPGVREVTVANLVSGSNHFMDRQVTTEGVVRTFAEPRHYWIEDDNHNRVGLTPAAEVSDLVGARIQVSGTFHFRENQGRLIDIDTLVVLAGAEP